MKKILYFILVTLLITSIFSLSCFAYSSEDTESTVTASAGEEDSQAEIEAESADGSQLEADSNSEADNTESSDNNTTFESPDETSGSESLTPTPDKDSKNESGESQSPEGSSENESFFTTLYNLCLEYIGELFAALACVFSALLMLAYKKGIIPLIKGGLSTISSGVSALSKEAEKQSELSDTISGVISEKLGCTQEIITKMQASVSSLEEKLNENEAQKKNSELFKLVLLEQVDMLYEVFMAATLPEYQKDRISEQVKHMREQLSEGDRNEEN